MPEQVAVKLPIGGEQMLLQQPDHRTGLADVAKRAPLRFELVHPPPEPTAKHLDRVALPCGSPCGQPSFDAGKQRVEVLEERGVARAAREIQIADHLLEETLVARIRLYDKAAHPNDAIVPGADMSVGMLMDLCCAAGVARD